MAQDTIINIKVGSRQQGKTALLRRKLAQHMSEMKAGDKIALLSTDPKKDVIITRNNDQIEGPK